MLDIYWNRIENVCALKYHCMRHDSITVSTLLIFLNFLNLCFQNSILFFLIILINLFNSNVLVISLLADFGCRPYHLWLLISSCLHNPCFSNFGFGVLGGGGERRVAAPLRGCGSVSFIRFSIDVWKVFAVFITLTIRPVSAGRLCGRKRKWRLLFAGIVLRPTQYAIHSVLKYEHFGTSSYPFTFL